MIFLFQISVLKADKDPDMRSHDDFFQINGRRTYETFLSYLNSPKTHFADWNVSDSKAFVINPREMTSHRCTGRITVEKKKCAPT